MWIVIIVVVLIIIVTWAIWITQYVIALDKSRMEHPPISNNQFYALLEPGIRRIVQDEIKKQL